MNITVNQHSYSNAYALLNVSATAIRTGTETISITANWEIYTAGSFYQGATRYLVLFIGSDSGEKYYSTAIGTDWSAQKTYKGSHTFTNIPLDATATSITIGFGVSASNTSLSPSGTLIWNGNSTVSHYEYNPNIQFNSITGIAQGTTACIAPYYFEGYVISDTSVRLEWNGAEGGTNNALKEYALMYRTKDYETEKISSWIQCGSVNSGYSYNEIELTHIKDVPRGDYIQYAIRAIGSAGTSYASDWVDSNWIRRNLSPTKPTNITIDKTNIMSGEWVNISWDESTDIDGNYIDYVVEYSINDNASTDDECFSRVSTGSDNTASWPVYGEPLDKIRFRIRAVDEFQVGSAWAYSDYVTIINNPPNAPTNLRTSKTSVISGSYIDVLWDGSVDVDGNLIGYRVQYSINDNGSTDDSYFGNDEICAAETTSYKITGNPLDKIRFRIRAEDEVNAVSGWVYSDYVTIIGTIYIYNGTSWDHYVICIYNGENFEKYKFNIM